MIQFSSISLTQQTATSCVDAISAEPFCADSTWVLWNATTGLFAPTSYFCCLPGQQGTQNMDCESAATEIVSSLQAVQIGQPTPSAAGADTATYSVSGTTENSAAAATGSTSGPSGPSGTGGTGPVTSVIAKTTVSGGKTVTVATTATGLVGSIESLASHFANSDAVAVRPLDFSGLRVAAAWFALVGAMVMGAFGVRLI